MSSKFQPSVYKGTTGQYFAEPAGDRSDYYWVTVHFAEDIDHRGIPDWEIMLFVKDMIRKGRFTIDDQAMHGLGKKCLSIPIKRDPDTPLPKSYTPDPTHPDLLLAENLAAYWKDQISFRKVTLDQRMIFVETRRKTKSPPFTPTTRMPHFQASVFQSSQLEHSHRFHFKDPHNSQPGWIWGTVALPKTMGIGTSDKEIIVHICETIHRGFVTWSGSSMHGLGKTCVSFAIKLETPQQDLKTLMIQLEYAALWWVDFICAESVSIDKHMLFRARQPPPDREDQLLDMPLYWDKPSAVNLWSSVTVLKE
ncbi:unnamed protein product [Penicillium glandicola]